MTLNECLCLNPIYFHECLWHEDFHRHQKKQTMVVAALWFWPPPILTTSTEKSVLICWRNIIIRTGRMTPLPKQGVIVPVRLGGSSLGIMIHDLNHWIRHDPPRISTHEFRSFFGFSARVVVVFGVCFSWHIWEPEVLRGSAVRGKNLSWNFLTYFFPGFFVGGSHLHGQLSVQGQNVDVQMMHELGCTWHSVCARLGVPIFKAPRSTKSKLPFCVNCNRFYRIRELISISNGCFL